MLFEDGAKARMKLRCGNFFKVLPGAERFAGAGEQNAANGSVFGCIVERSLQLKRHLAVERVENFGAIQRYGANWILGLYRDEFHGIFDCFKGRKTNEKECLIRSGWKLHSKKDFNCVKRDK